MTTVGGEFVGVGTITISQGRVMAVAQRGQGGPRFNSLMLNYLVFASIGIMCSLLYNSYYGSSDIVQHHNLLSSLTEDSEHSLEEVREVLRTTDCAEVKREAKIADDIKHFMASKLRYQFDSTVEDESFIGHCRALKVYGLFRHGTRYPTIKHLSKWEKLQQKLLDRLSSDAALSDKAKTLRHWTNPLNQDVVSGKAEATELTKGGMKEQYCLARRLRERFPEVVGNTYSPLTCGLRSTQVSRTVKSALSFAEGLFGESKPKIVSVKSLKERNDVLLRFDELPCPEYDRRVTHNKSQLDGWFNTFFNTAACNGVLQNIQRHFNPEHWEVGMDDVLNFYSICIHEMSILGESSWCDLFDPEDLSVLVFFKDVKAYWMKGSGYPITGKRTVHLVHSILEFFTKGRQPLSLSFAHAETVLPLLSFLKVFPVPTDLTPTNYQELKSRDYVTSRLVPYSANLQFVLYDCTKEDSDPTKSPHLYVRLLVNEEPRHIGLCTGSNDNDVTAEDQWAHSHALCKLQTLRDSAHNATQGFSPLTRLCKGPS